MKPARLISILIVFAIAVVASNAQQMPTDVEVTALNTWPTPVKGGAVDFSVEVRNIGQYDALQYLIEVQVFYQQELVFSAFEERGLLAVDASRTDTIQMQWVPENGGEHNVLIRIAIENDVNPPNNTLVQTLQVGEYITREEATNILNQEIANLPNQSSLRAYSVVAGDGADSVLQADSEIRNWDGILRTLLYPSYVFFVDIQPSLLWEHEALIVTIPAVPASGLPVLTDPTRSPISINNQAYSLGPVCGPNSRRVRGAEFTCTPIPAYTKVSTSNTRDWAIIVTGRVIQDVDSITIGHDVARVVKRLNEGQYGLKINGDNISVVQGSAGNGATKQEFCDALDAIKGQECDKVYIKYIGHGTTAGLVLQNAARTDTEILPWTEFASKVAGLNAGNTCVDITACHAGSAVAPLRDSGVKGTVVTSSNVRNETPQGTGSGTYWERALEECSQQEFADTDRDGNVTLKESARWVYARRPTTDSALLPVPQVVCLNDSIRRQNVSVDVVNNRDWLMAGNSGPLTVYLQRTCVRTRYRGASRDSTVYRNNIYVSNPSAVARVPRRAYEIVAVCGRGRSAQQRVIATIQPQLEPRSEICIGTIPNDCNGMIVRQLPARRGIPQLVETSDSAALVGYFSATVVAEPGDYVRYHHEFFDPQNAERYTGDTEGSSGWTFAAEPNRFSSRADTITGFDVWAWVPEDSANGSTLTTTLINDTTFSETRFVTNILTPVEFNSTSGDLQNGHHRFVTASEGFMKIPQEFANSIIVATSDVNIGITNDSRVSNVVVDVDSNSNTELAINATNSTVEFLSLYGLTDVDISFSDNSTVNHIVNSGSTIALHPQQAQSSATIRGLSSYGAENIGIVVDLEPLYRVTLYNAVVEGAAGMDLTTRGTGGSVACVDCEVSPESIAPTFGASVSLRQTLSAVVADTLGQPISNAVVRVRSNMGQIIDSIVTGEEGVGTTVVEYTNISDVLYDIRPLTLELVQGNMSTISRSVAGRTYHQEFFVDTSKTVSVKLVERHHARVAPHPIPKGSLAELHSVEPILAAEVYSIQGEQLALLETNDTNRVVLSSSVLPVGSYVVRYRTHRGWASLPFIVY